MLFDNNEEDFISDLKMFNVPNDLLRSKRLSNLNQNLGNTFNLT